MSVKFLSHVLNHVLFHGLWISCLGFILD